MALEGDAGKLNEDDGPFPVGLLPADGAGNRPDDVLGRLSNPSGNPLPPPPERVLQSSMTESRRDVGRGCSSSSPERVAGREETGRGCSAYSSPSGYGRFRELVDEKEWPSEGGWKLKGESLVAWTLLLPLTMGALFVHPGSGRSTFPGLEEADGVPCVPPVGDRRTGAKEEADWYCWCSKSTLPC